MSQINFHCLAGALALLLSSACEARDINDQYAVFGVGAENCAAYLVARDHGGTTEQRYHHWLAGFLTAVNNAGASTYNILGQKSMADILDWLEGYCMANPNTVFSNAVADMTAILYPDRQNIGAPRSNGWNTLIDEQTDRTASTDPATAAPDR
ncbi:MAG: hypothetical protein RQ736_01660 [Thiogranum sp.]|nr:hypothetical protein [Thiogranum sp.]